MSLSMESRGGEVGGPTSLLASSKRLIYHTFKWVSIVAVVTIFVSLLLGVVVRYLFSTNLGWVSEVPNLVFPWLTMCAIVAAAARNEHIGVELVVEKLPRLPKKVVVLAVNLIAMIAFSFMAVHGLDVVEIAGSQRLPITRIGMSWAYWSVVVGFMGLAVISFINIAMVLSGGDLNQSSEPQVAHGEEGI
ncbi:TRAP transporter small permease [Halomonas sp. ISL-60]|uniref:TRAP transporter small permease n=1 Tax=Halomonas sp. ISL-56 TaxID=2819149 RepID=UPI001BE7F306|nr:TRAP transporter small permease [Halomonas sp. ISL-56]MBT2771594.1 TRAP transporter small permease [Halomonas sp. ISL-60]MBT2801341.1 TRAP transporter small permease [Halomonas sp. ISL-56]